MRLEKAVAVLKLARSLAGNFEGFTLDEMAGLVGVSRRTAERMRDAVAEAFGPLDDIDDGKKKRFRLTARGLGTFANIPSVDELTELQLAVKSLKTKRSYARAALLQSLSDKIAASLREADRRRLNVDVESALRAEAFACQVGPRPIADPNALSTLREALLAGRIVAFKYGDGSIPRRLQRVIPFGIIFGPRYYLVGCSKGHADPFLFRIDRMANVALTDEVGIPPPSFDIRQYAERSFGVFQEPPQDIVLRFASSAAQDARSYQFHPTQTIIDQSDGSIIVQFRAGGLLQIAHHLLTWGPTVTVRGPPALEALMQNLAIGLYNHHASKAVRKSSKRRAST